MTTLHTLTTRAGVWRVQRRSGLLIPGFSKRFDATGSCGVTRLGGVHIGTFDMHAMSDGAVELRYRRWPVVDVLRHDCERSDGTYSGTGYLAIGARRARFCTFALRAPRR